MTSLYLSEIVVLTLSSGVVYPPVEADPSVDGALWDHTYVTFAVAGEVVVPKQ